MSLLEFVGGIAVTLVITNLLTAYYSRGLKSAQEAHTKALLEDAAATREHSGVLREMMDRSSADDEEQAK